MDMGNSKENGIRMAPPVSSENYEDALAMLQAVYLRIFKVNLTDDTYVTVKDETAETNGMLTGYKTMSARLAAYADLGYIYEDDKENYLAFVALDHLRVCFADGRRYVGHRYRRIIGDHFHWVTLDAMRSAEWQNDRRIVILAVRDINDEYIAQMDAAVQRVSGQAAIVTMGISRDFCLTSASASKELCIREHGEKVDDYLTRISSLIPRKNVRRSFLASFNRKNILESYANGRRKICMELTLYFDGKKSYRYCMITAELVKNSFTDEVEAVMTFTDNTDIYLAEKIPALIYQQRFCQTAIIDAGKQTISIKKTRHGRGHEKWRAPMDYAFFLKDIMQRMAFREDFETLKKQFSLENLKKELDENGRCSLSVHQLDEEGKKTIRRYSFVYLQKEIGMILATAENITELYGRDSLTGGCNRDGFIQRVEELLAGCSDRTEYALLFFDISNFKVVNELFGVQSGDEILRGTFGRLANSPILRPIVAARIEADHFVLFVKRKNLYPDNLMKICRRAFSKNGKTLYMLATIGLYMVNNDSVNVSGMIDRAQLAKNCISDPYVQPFRVYNDTMRNEYVGQAEASAGLNEAIRENQFQVWFQPIVESSSGRVLSAEALIRWKHPEKGCLSPGMFIPPIERNGQISELDHYVAASVCRFLEERQHAGKLFVPVSINLSWMDFYDETLMRQIQKRLDGTTLPKGTLRLEVTETSYAALDKNHAGILNQFREKGAQILLDDFGTGYSSLGTLQDYVFDIIKIDMSFVHRITNNPKSRSVLAAIIETAHSIGFSLVAEGAETREQVDFLKENGCDYIQGYYFYKPMPKKEFEALLDAMEKTGTAF